MSKESGDYVKSLREITGLTQRDFAGKYDINRRTIEEWEVGRRVAPNYVWALLERVVREDYSLPWKFSVVRIIGNDEKIQLTTYNRFVAIQYARTIEEQAERNGLEDKIEVRLYAADGNYELIDHAVHVKYIYYINNIEEQESIFMTMLNPSIKTLEKLKEGELVEKDGHIFRIERKEI